jgi:hypothetical protein
MHFIASPAAWYRHGFGDFGRSPIVAPRFCRFDEPELNARLTANSASPGQSLAWVEGLLPTAEEGKIHACLTKDCCFRYFVRHVGTTVSAAFAETQWERSHPRRDQVNDRLANQNRRIKRELKEGEITRQQAHQLHREDHAIRQEERDMAKINGGHITKGEQKVLNQQENAVSRQIGR